MGSAEHGDLVPQHEELGVLGGRRATEQDQPAADPVGLEYTIRAVNCVSSKQPGMSGGDQVLVREPAENLFSADRILSEIDLRWPGVSLSRCELAKATVREVVPTSVELR